MLLRTVARLGDNRAVINKFKGFLQKLKDRRHTSSPAAEEDADAGVDAELELDEGSSPASRAKLGLAWREAISTLARKSGLESRMRQSGINALADKLLAKESLTQHHRVFLLALLLGGTYSVGKLLALFLRGRPVHEAPRVVLDLGNREEFNASSLGVLRTQDPFKTGDAAGPKKVADTKCESSETPTNLPLKLVNTVVLQDSVKSIASVQVRSGRDLMQVHEGDELDGMARVARILRLSVVVKNLQTGACELVTNEKMQDQGSPITIMSPARGAEFKRQQKIKGIENMGNKFIISRELLDEKLKDINSVLTQARAIKIQNPDGTLAFKITEIEPGGIFAYLGIQDQDVITSINGKPISDLNEVMGLFGRIKNLDQLQLGIRREGDESQLDYVMKQ